MTLNLKLFCTRFAKVCRDSPFSGFAVSYGRVTTMPEPKQHPNRRHTDGIGEPLWTLGKGPRRLACELFDNGAHGAEYRLLIDGEVYTSRRFSRLDLAVGGAEDIRRQLEHDGWTGR